MFGIKAIEGFADCWVISILIDILSEKKTIWDEIAVKIIEFIHECKMKMTKMENELLLNKVVEVLQIKNFKQAIFYAKLIHDDMSETQK